MFVHIDRTRADVDDTELDRLGLGPDPAGVSTAALSPAQVGELTDADWVVSLRLSGRLRLLREPAPPASSAPAGDHQAGAGNERRRPEQDKGKARPT